MAELFNSFVEALERSPLIDVELDAVAGELSITTAGVTLVFRLPPPDELPIEDLDAWTQGLINGFWQAQAGVEVDGPVDSPAD